MVRAVARRSVAMAPTAVAREQVVQRREQVIIGAGSQLHDHEAGRRVRHEDAEQPVALAIDEARAGRREVGQGRV